MKKNKKGKLEEHVFLLTPDFIIIGNDNMSEGEFAFGRFLLSVQCPKDAGKFLREAMQQAVDSALKMERENK
jgi:hypothetical protein